MHSCRIKNMSVKINCHVNLISAPFCLSFLAGECDKFKNLCNLTLHQYNCQETCGLCGGDPLRPINTVGICYRDSPCNEGGTDGGNANGCILTEEYPFFKCKCKENYDGWRCQWYNCPCQNGGNCLECQEINGVACRDNPICTCRKGFKVFSVLFADS